ncbi:hypothetical protein [Brevibacterium oceani]|uniref:hypothetical protein n=1 Tax=Brevibacterium oceani TaxID=358099 RepID=UPI0015E649BE|nr:hypothetical protein [Brevibacterium oceani]
MRTKIEIRFFPDWGRKEPLWSHDTDDYVVKTSDLPITESLAKGLHNYMDFWAEHYNPVADYPEPDWDSEENRIKHDEEGDRLIRELRTQLEGQATISDER